MADEDSKLFDSLERESKEFDKVSYATLEESSLLMHASLGRRDRSFVAIAGYYPQSH